MQSICILYKQTKKGLSTFHFCKTEDGQFWMFGGITPKAIQFDSLKELKAAITSWRRMGFTFTKPSPKRVAKPSWDLQDPWESDLPSSLQEKLFSLEPSPC